MKLAPIVEIAPEKNKHLWRTKMHDCRRCDHLLLDLSTMFGYCGVTDPLRRCRAAWGDEEKTCPRFQKRPWWKPLWLRSFV